MSLGNIDQNMKIIVLIEIDKFFMIPDVRVNLIKNMIKINKIDMQNLMFQEIPGNMLKSSTINHHKNILIKEDLIYQKNVNIGMIGNMKNQLMTIQGNNFEARMNLVTKINHDTKMILVQKIINTRKFRFKIDNKFKEKDILLLKKIWMFKNIDPFS